MDIVLEVEAIVTRFGAQTIHNRVSFAVRRGEVVALIGGSGTGKSVLLREITGLMRPTAGRVRLFGSDVWRSSLHEMSALRRRFGMLFQDGALFSSLTVAENIAVPFRENTDLPKDLISRLVGFKLGLVGLPADTGPKTPAQLSGGMRKRVALARALALEPEIVFLDEPTSGLDPVSARAFDRLVRALSDSLGLTVFIVTHDVDTLLSIVDRTIVLSGGQVIADGPVNAVMKTHDHWIKEYFSARAPVAQGQG
jgi:phospholipid/cholesterol/gamma-HCH transport system ATP-binding protein